MLSGTLTSVTDLELFAGANTLAIESSRGRLGNRPVRQCRACLGGPLQADTAAARPARHRRRHWQSGACRRARRHARRRHRALEHRFDRCRHRLQLDDRPGVRRPDGHFLCAGGVHAERHWAPALCGGPCQPAMEVRQDARRSDDLLEAPHPRAWWATAGMQSRFRCSRTAKSYEVDILDGATVKRTLAIEHHQRPLHRRPADRRLGRAAGAGRQPASRHLPSSRPQFGRGAPKLETLYF